jgi:TolA-binding protein
MDTVSGQVQSLNDSVDEVKSRIAKLDKSIQDLQSAVAEYSESLRTSGRRQRRQAPLHRRRRRRPRRNGKRACLFPLCLWPLQLSRRKSDAAAGKETFQAGVRDYNAARYEVAAGEFQDVLHYYPLDEMAGTAQFYLGEIAYRQKNLTERGEGLQRRAGRLPRQPQGSRGATAQGPGAVADGQARRRPSPSCACSSRRHPQTPEAAQARTKLNGMGIKPSAAK